MPAAINRDKLLFIAGDVVRIDCFHVMPITFDRRDTGNVLPLFNHRDVPLNDINTAA